jgi:hypothetical protein
MSHVSSHRLTESLSHDTPARRLLDQIRHANGVFSDGTTDRILWSMFVVGATKPFSSLRVVTTGPPISLVEARRVWGLKMIDAMCRKVATLRIDELDAPPASATVYAVWIDNNEEQRTRFLGWLVRFLGLELNSAGD